MSDPTATVSTRTTPEHHTSTPEGAVCNPRFHSRHLDPAEHDRDPGVLEDSVEQGGELAVAVPDQEPRPAAGILQVHDEVPGGLDDPRTRRLSGYAQDPDPAAGVLNRRQHEQAGTGQGDGLEEVAGDQG